MSVWTTDDLDPVGRAESIELPAYRRSGHVRRP
jgi:hypothetical protein